MKIFGKRSRKSTLSEQDPVQPSSDAIVEQLLQQDPTSWNAKQRRLIKRYHERRPHSIAEQTPAIDGSISQENENSIKNSEKLKEEPTNLAEESNTGEQENVNDDVNDPAQDDDKGNSVKGESPTQPTESILECEERKSHESSEVSKGTIDEDLQAMLDRLNSKERRKLTRAIERGGDVEAARSEARRILGMDNEKDKTNDPSSTSVTEQPPKKKRRRRSSIDWSKLSTEERLRREDQKRLQQEASTRTASSSTPLHRHPLNSERRRANRRKPKWESRNDRAPFHNEHNSSGFQMRKTKSSEGV